MTTRCISIAARPSAFGRTLFPAAFAARGLDWTYEPLEVRTESRLHDAIADVRRGVRGCGVSMPWKTAVMRLLDDIDPVARRIGAVNTIVNDSGRLTGHNTDYLGALAVYRGRISKGARVLLCGAGGVARAQALALKELGADVHVTAREAAQAQALAGAFGLKTLPWGERTSFKGDLLVNCTPVGMEPDAEGIVVPSDALKHFRVVADLVIKPPRTRLIVEAEKEGCVGIPGWAFVLEQALVQFRLYTGEEPPRAAMEAAMRMLL